MNIFDPHVTGSLSVSGSAEISGDLTVLGTINATISGTTSNAISASHAANYTLTSSFGSFTSSYTTGSFTGSFIGDGSGLTNIPASGVTGLNLTQIADGSVTASVSNANGLRVNSNTEITGSLTVTGNIVGSVDFDTLRNKPTLVSGSSQVTISSTTGYSTFSSSISTSIGSLSSSIDSSIGTLSSSIGSLSSSVSSSIGNLSSSVGTLSSSITTIDSNQNGRLDSIETSTGSLNSFTSSIDTTIKNKLNVDGVISGSSQISLGMTNGYTTFSSSISSSIGQLSSSVASKDFLQDGYIDSIIGKTGSYATTGSNVFVGDQTISGSIVIRENLTVFGSSSIVYVTSSQLRVDDNIITLNTSTPGQRFGGIEVYDSGSVTQATGSILWDSVNNRWIYQQSSESTYGGGLFLSGPRSSGSLGSELTLTSGKIARSAGGDHLNDSIITEYGATTIGINGGLEITGSILSTVTPLVSGSGQISYTGIVNVPSGIISGSSQVVSLLPVGTVSGSSQVLSGTGIWSGSAQLPAGVVSGSSQVLLSSGIWSGSAQLPGGTVSGSSQISFGSISGVPSGIVSGSSQVLSGTGIWSGSAQLPSGVVSGSSQVTFGSLSGVPSGLVSGSSQITLTSTQVTNGLGFTPATDTHTHNLSRYSLRAPDMVDTLTASNFRTVVFGSSSSGYSLSAARWNSVPTGISGMNMYGTLFAWAGSDTHGFIATDYSTANVQVGGGSGDAITWKATLVHSANIGSQSVSYATTSGNITAYTINQNLGTGNSPTFAGLTSNNSATIYRDLYINGGASGNYGNRLLIGGTSATYTMEDTNLRPVIYSTGAYPVLTLNHTVTSNTSHGPTIQFTHYTADKQWVIGTNGSGTQMDFGYSTNTNRNPHNGIDNYQGNTYLRITNDGYIRTWSHFIPTTSAALDLGTSSLRWRTIYTSDLSLSNGIGDYTIVEGEEKLYLYNNKNNKVYSFVLQEEDPTTATPKLPQ
jgi:hypothetical protein